MSRRLRPLWFRRSRLRGAPRALLGILELPRRPGAPAFELHLARPKGGGPSLAAWLDDGGRRWLVVEAGVALGCVRRDERGCHGGPYRPDRPEPGALFAHAAECRPDASEVEGDASPHVSARASLALGQAHLP
jgi:hypothetical protein